MEAQKAYGKQAHNIQVYMAKFCKDKPLMNMYDLPDWIIPIQAGAVLTAERVCSLLDNSGRNISCKNANYCELTVLYWIWKNQICKNTDICARYYGLFHYRRFLDIREEDIKYINEGSIDVILPFPTVHEPDICEHHERYICSSDWDAAKQALKELQPEYYAAYDNIFSGKYLYNYNMIIAKTEVLKKYCEWLFPILERVEELSVPKGSERADRYIGYIGESLLTLYFMHNENRLNIVHTGKIMLT